MTLQDKILLGSKTAKAGFRNEQDIIDHFNNWEKDDLAQGWLEVMGYKLKEIEFVKAVKVSGSFKTDVQVQIQIIIKLKGEIDCENLSIKLVSNPKGFNQIDKRWIKKYTELWTIDPETEKALQHFTGELSPYIDNPRDKRRMFADELSQKDLARILIFLKENRMMIIADILKGRGKFSAEWFLVILKNKISTIKNLWSLRPINEVLNFYNGEVSITKRGSFAIGKITMQRKGGDNGRPSANMLQFKLNPALLIKKDA